MVYIENKQQQQNTTTSNAVFFVWTKELNLLKIFPLY